ncbi:MAG: flavin reductase family protein [Candidatus Acidiferrales bacterium]
MPVTTAEFRKALGQYVTGVTVVTVTREPGRIHGMTANSFTSVSLEPMQVLVCVDRRARTHPLVLAHRFFGINILAENQEALARYFTAPEQDAETGQRLGVRFRASDRGTPLLEGSLVQIDCRLISAIEAGDHSIFVGEVHSMEMRVGRPLLFHAGQYQRLPQNE